MTQPNETESRKEIDQMKKKKINQRKEVSDCVNY